VAGQLSHLCAGPGFEDLGGVFLQRGDKKVPVRTQCETVQFLWLDIDLRDLLPAGGVPDANHPVRSAGDDPLAAGSEQRRNDFCVVGQHGHTFTRGRSPDAGGVIFAGGDEPLTVRTVRDVANLLGMALQFEKGFPAGDIAHGRIPVHQGHAAAIWTETGS